MPLSRISWRTISTLGSSDLRITSLRSASNALICSSTNLRPAYSRSTRARKPLGKGEQSHKRTSSIRVRKSYFTGSRTPCPMSTPLIRLMWRVRSRLSVVNSRWRCRLSFDSTLGTFTKLHAFFSPKSYRISIVSNLPTSKRSVFARLARRGTSMLAASTTKFSMPCVTR